MCEALGTKDGTVEEGKVGGEVVGGKEEVDVEGVEAEAEVEVEVEVEART